MADPPHPPTHLKAIVYVVDGTIARIRGIDPNGRWHGNALPVDVNRFRRTNNTLRPHQASTSAHHARLIRLGATVVNDNRPEFGWVVLADPQGNEFCVLADRRP